jgi:type VI secretion system ImpC/EvpB family protein/type VI secretion system ImpB/VipA family protein
MPAHIEFDMLLRRNRPGQARPGGQEEAEQDDQPERFRVLVLGDFSGRAADAPTPWRDGALQRVDFDNFDTVLSRMAPALALHLPGSEGAAVNLSVRSLDDFEPDALYAHLPLFARLRDLRARLGQRATFEQAAAELRGLDLGEPPNAAPPAAAAAAPAAASAPAEDDRATLERLLGGALPPAAATAAAPATPGGVQARLDALLKQVVAPHVQPDAPQQQQALIDAVDRAIGASMRALLRHPQWRGVEAAWRSVDRLLRSVDGETLHLELLDVRADEVLADLAQAQGDAAQSSLVKLLAQRAQREGQPPRYAVVAALYEFGPSPLELALLAGLGAVATQCGGALLAASAPAVLGVASSGAPGDPAQWQPDAAAQTAWSALRASWVARHIGLVFPRVLGRLPYGPKTQPVSAFAFDELADGFAHERLVWRSAVLDAVALLAQAHAEEGMAFQPEQHVLIDDLPAYVDRSGGEARLQACAEAYLSDRQLAAIRAQGVMPLASDRSAPRARLGGWHSIAADGAPLAGPWQT